MLSDCRWHALAAEALSVGDQVVTLQTRKIGIMLKEDLEDSVRSSNTAGQDMLKMWRRVCRCKRIKEIKKKKKKRKKRKKNHQ